MVAIRKPCFIFELCVEKDFELIYLHNLKMTEEKVAKAKEKIEKSVLERVDHLNEMRREKEKVVSHNQLNLKHINEAEKHALLENIKIKDQKVSFGKIHNGRSCSLFSLD